MQKCQVCGKTGPDEFYSRVNTYCKEHWRELVRVKRKANTEKNRAYEKARANLPHRIESRERYAKTDSGKVARARAHATFSKNYPLKRAAHIAVGNAVRDGRLVKMPCEVCGASSAEAHHDDYDKPLDVRWLCESHHDEWHRHNTPKYPNDEQIMEKAA